MRVYKGLTTRVHECSDAYPAAGGMCNGHYSRLPLPAARDAARGLSDRGHICCVTGAKYAGKYAL